VNTTVIAHYSQVRFLSDPLQIFSKKSKVNSVTVTLCALRTGRPLPPRRILVRMSWQVSLSLSESAAAS
jgi:hypothetical protein